MPLAVTGGGHRCVGHLCEVARLHGRPHRGWKNPTVVGLAAAGSVMMVMTWLVNPLTGLSRSFVVRGRAATESQGRHQVPWDLPDEPAHAQIHASGGPGLFQSDRR